MILGELIALILCIIIYILAWYASKKIKWESDYAFLKILAITIIAVMTVVFAYALFTWISTFNIWQIKIF